MENLQYKEEILISEKKLRNKTILAFIVFFALLTSGVLAWKKIREQPTIAAVPKPVRTVLDFNGTFFSNFLNDDHLARSYPVSEAVTNVRVNGNVGMGNNFDPSAWKLQVIRKPGDTLFLTLGDIKALPKTDIIFDFKCIEGWSQVTHWAGVRFSDFAARYNLNAQTQMKYVGLATPDKQYYVGIDMASMMHPQTILCYEMNGRPLPMDQGYPLRLIIPVKYGIKHLKRIGTMTFSNERPPDYWYERGYDYFSGL
ncbi:MAG TPA: molybdopterin-dependent oxidoreductase [Chitinophagaceae bacterium]|nr:molybdopterin-dependent oxidoreductase [Chitinophagaceae bacterium]